MTDLEKLAKLFDEADDICSTTKCLECKYNGKDCWSNMIADHLISHGVTFIPAVPGHEDQYNIAEMAYNNGYEKGFADGKREDAKVGRWIIHSNGHGRNATNWAECSECHVCGSPQWKVCPVCETKMEPPVNGYDPDELMGEYEDENE